MILARHAEATFWAGRHLERAEHTTRMLDVATRDSMHFPNSPVQPEWLRLLEVMAVDRGFAASGALATGPTVAQYLVIDPTNEGSVSRSVGQLRENIRTVRDRVPVELWEEANRLQLTLLEVGQKLPPEPFELYSTIRRRCHALSGIVSEAMPRDEAFTFLVLGRMIERAIICCRTVRYLVLHPDHTLDEGSILRTVSSLQAYRRRSRQGGDPHHLGAFLLQADDVPRSVLSCLRRADGRIRRLVQGTASGLAPAAMVSGRLRSHLEYTNVEQELRDDAGTLLGRIEAELVNLATAIGDYAFDPAQIPDMHSQFVRPGQPDPARVEHGRGGR
jgi:uncharacterized alpha-E superfamily protein